MPELPSCHHGNEHNADVFQAVIDVAMDKADATNALAVEVDGAMETEEMAEEEEAVLFGDEETEVVLGLQKILSATTVFEVKLAACFAISQVSTK